MIRALEGTPEPVVPARRPRRLNRRRFVGLAVVGAAGGLLAACAPAAPSPAAAPTKPAEAAKPVAASPAASPATAASPAASPSPGASPSPSPSPSPATKPSAQAPVAALPPADPSQQALQFRMATVYGEATTFLPYERRFAQLVRERTDGKIQIEHFCCAQLGGEREIADGVKLGSIGMGMTGATGFPKFDLTFMPFLFRDAHHVLKVMNGPIGDRLAADFLQERGVGIFAFSWTGNRNFLTKPRMARTPEDLRGQKIRAPEIPVLAAYLRALGASPVVIPYPELYTSLQQGVADGWEGPVEFMVNDKHWEVAKNLSMVRWINQVGYGQVNAQLWERMTPTTKQIVTGTWAQIAVEIADETLAKEKAALDTLRQNGMEVYEPDVALFRDATKDVWREFAPQTWGPGVYEQIQATQ